MDYMNWRIVSTRVRDDGNGTINWMQLSVPGGESVEGDALEGEGYVELRDRLRKDLMAKVEAHSKPRAFIAKPDVQEAELG